MVRRHSSLQSTNAVQNSHRQTKPCPTQKDVIFSWCCHTKPEMDRQDCQHFHFHVSQCFNTSTSHNVNCYSKQCARQHVSCNISQNISSVWYRRITWSDKSTMISTSNMTNMTTVIMSVITSSSNTSPNMLMVSPPQRSVITLIAALGFEELLVLITCISHHYHIIWLSGFALYIQIIFLLFSLQLI